MTEGFAYLDILFFAMVAAFVALRLRNVLGRRTGNEQQRGQQDVGRPVGSPDNVVNLPERGKAAAREAAGLTDIEDPVIQEGLTKIHTADGRFELPGFLEGARAAFTMIVEAFAAGDKETLRPLLSPGVYENFARAVDTRARNGESLETRLVAIRTAEPVAADLVGSEARVSVRFKSEQSNTLRDAQGEVVPEESHDAEEVVDVWTFARDVRSRDPNWTLIETRSGE